MRGARRPHLSVAPLEDHCEGAVPNQVLARELELAHDLQAAAAGLHGAGRADQASGLARLRRRRGPGAAGWGRAPSGRPGPLPAWPLIRIPLLPDPVLTLSPTRFRLGFRLGVNGNSDSGSGPGRETKEPRPQGPRT